MMEKLGLIRTPKERLGAVILDALRCNAPAAGYHFEECSGIYQLTLYWGSSSTKLTFNQEQALSADTEHGKRLISTKLSSALASLINQQSWRQAS